MQFEVDQDVSYEQQLDLLLKYTGSIKMLLIPSDENYLEMKGFTWSLIRFTEDQITFKIDFENPHYISSYGHDTLMVSFYNSEFFMVP